MMRFTLTRSSPKSDHYTPYLLYSFTVLYSVDEETLWIDDCDRMFDDPKA
jgi:hypothetical protein